MSQSVVVQRVVGMTQDIDQIIEFTEWLGSNVSDLEKCINEKDPFNGQISFDYNKKTLHWSIEVQTVNEGFANRIKNQFETLGFPLTRKIGDVRTI